MILDNDNIYDYVVKNNRDIKINLNKIDNLVSEISDINYIHWINEFKQFFLDEELILLVFLCESINFCFWNSKYIKIYNNKMYKGSEALFYTFIRESLLDKNFLTLDYLGDLTFEKFKEIFTDEFGNTISLLEIRYQKLIETINILIEKGENLYLELYNINSCQELLSYILKNFQGFEDYGTFNNKIIMFNKRANLLVNDLFQISDIIKYNIKNIHGLHGCADYQVPNLLRNSGILIYCKELADIIDNGILLEHNSIYEIEIRASMLWVIDFISKKTNIPSIVLDNILWKYSKTKEKKYQHHRCITTSY